MNKDQLLEVLGFVIAVLITIGLSLWFFIALSEV